MKPELIKDQIPWASTLQNFECELIARNIMVILHRTGNKFRKLEWNEYKEERLKDGQFSDSEKYFFDRVSYLSLGKRDEIENFSKDWKRLI